MKTSSRNTSSLDKENEKLHLDLKDLNERLISSEASRTKLEKENEELSIKSKWLNKALEKFSCGSQAFKIVLASRKYNFDKKGLG